MSRFLRSAPVPACCAFNFQPFLLLHVFCRLASACVKVSESVPDAVFACVPKLPASRTADLRMLTARNLNNQKIEFILPSWLHAVGWPCPDMSLHNSKRRTFTDALGGVAGNSASAMVVDDLIAHVHEHQPDVVVMENVPSL
mgnify:CR=1 FL=1